MTPTPSRRNLLHYAALLSASAVLGFPPRRGFAEPSAPGPSPERIAGETLDFIRRCARPDGSYAPSPDASYGGNSDTSLSDLAAVTYAAVLAKTMGWTLPHPERSIEFIHRHQQADGRFINLGGAMDAKDPLAILYNTTQGIVALRALGDKPKIDPAPVLEPFFRDGAYKKLPWYTTSFFPLFFAALEKPFPREYETALADHMTSHQADDGYLQDHVAATFHMAHFFRLIDKPTPRARQMVERTLHDQKPTGGWDLKEPDWDVHACFDALFIVRQLGTQISELRERSLAAMSRGGQWAMSCRNADGGFGHFPAKHSDMDAVYFNFGSVLQAGVVALPKPDMKDARTLSWGHAMVP